MNAWQYRGWLLPFILLGVAEFGIRTSGIESHGIALPSDIAKALTEVIASGEVFVRTWETIAAILLGLGIGGTIGAILGIFLGLSRSASRIASLAIELFRPIPPVADLWIWRANGSCNHCIHMLLANAALDACRC